MVYKIMPSRFAYFFLIFGTAFSQDAVPLNQAEKQFQESMTNVALEGFYTRGNGKELLEDRYVIERISKVKDDIWKFEARIQYNKKDTKMAINVPVKFAGDTPVVSLTNFGIPGSGSFSARVVFYDGAYAGTWAPTGKTGGKMFGKIVKLGEPAKTEPK